MLSKPLMTVREVAGFLRIPEDTVRQWIHAKSLRAIRVDRDWRVAVLDLERFLDARVNPPPAEDGSAPLR